MPKLSVDRASSTEAAEILKTIAHPLRLQIVAILCDQEENVSRLAERLGVTQAIVSQQLRILRMKKLVARRHENGFSVYRVTEPHLLKIVSCLESCLAKRS